MLFFQSNFRSFVIPYRYGDLNSKLQFSYSFVSNLERYKWSIHCLGSWIISPNNINGVIPCHFQAVSLKELFKFKFKFIYSHLFNYNTTTIRKKQSKNRAIHWIKHNKGKKCVAAKGAMLSSWLLPQSVYKWVEVILSTRHLGIAIRWIHGYTILPFSVALRTTKRHIMGFIVVLSVYWSGYIDTSRAFQLSELATQTMPVILSISFLIRTV